MLNSDEHATYLQRKGQDPALFRPDICHQALLAILDSPLNKAGKVKVLVSIYRKILELLRLHAAEARMLILVWASWLVVLGHGATDWSVRAVKA